MTELLPTIRNTVRAIIVKDDQVLLLQKLDDNGPRYALPGGGQDTGESLQESLQRECMEEIGSKVTIKQLLHIADYFKIRTTTPESKRHLVEFLFVCEVADDYQPGMGSHPDKHQVGVAWADLSELRKFPVFARFTLVEITRYLTQYSSQPIYLGLVKD